MPTGSSEVPGISPPIFSVKNNPSDDRITAENLGPYALRSTIITLEHCNDEAVTLNIPPSATATCAADLSPDPDPHAFTNAELLAYTTAHPSPLTPHPSPPTPHPSPLAPHPSHLNRCATTRVDPATGEKVSVCGAEATCEDKPMFRDPVTGASSDARTTSVCSCGGQFNRYVWRAYP